MLEVPLKIEEHGEDSWRSCRCVLLHRLGTKSKSQVKIFTSHFT